MSDITGNAPTAPRLRVRDATVTDLAELVRLDRMSREHLRPLKGGEMYLLHTARLDPPEASLSSDLDDDQCVVSVAELDDEIVVGYAIARLRTLADSSCVADVAEIFVEAPARDIGVGHALMTQLVQWATDRGCVGIDARALPGDRSTKNFFESFGLVARAITVHRDLRTG